jgi:hypothetical protein
MMQARVFQVHTKKIEDKVHAMYAQQVHPRHIHILAQ